VSSHPAWMALLNTWFMFMVTCATAPAGHAQEEKLDMSLVHSFANMAESVTLIADPGGFGSYTALVIRPRGAWTFLRTDSTTRWFEAPADSVAFRLVVIRLLQLGFAHEWPETHGTERYPPTAWLALTAPGQCHTNTSGVAQLGRRQAAEWRAARAMLDSLAANAAWQPASAPEWAAKHPDLWRLLCGREPDDR
jgi:hypothetical protein